MAVDITVYDSVAACTVYLHTLYVYYGIHIYIVYTVSVHTSL